jgi:hypothetical protein
MFTTNHFAELSASISPGIMQAYVVLMILLVVGGTLFDVMHKKSAKYFADLVEKSEASATRTVGGGQKMSIAVQTLAADVLTSAEFCNPHRRIAHLLGMYGFVIYVISTVFLVFGGADVSGLWIFLWYLSALMVAGGGYWFWFFIRVDVAAEGQSPFRLVRADLFIVSLLGCVTFGFFWAIFESFGGGALSVIFLILYIAATTVLFAGVPWSKFAHMFFKPAAAFQKRMAKANGSAMNLPTLTRDDPEQQQRHSMALLRDAPMDMGLGIKREEPRHY